MKFFAALLTLPLALAAPVLEDRADGSILNQWIAVMKKDAGSQENVLGQITNVLGSSPKHTYDVGGFRGFALTAQDNLVDALKSIADIEYLEPDYKVSHASAKYQQRAPWGLARLSSEHMGSDTYVYDSSAGEGTTAYVIDTGIFCDHPEFEGRAKWGANFIEGEKAQDLHGHGTHVAGTIGSKTYGVAKKTNLVAVKVLDAEGSGSTSALLAGIQWAVKDAKSKGIKKAVANMSLGGPRLLSHALNDAVAEATSQGLFVAVAAGNDYLPAKLYSPASEPSACTVGAIESNDRKADFSNYGSLVDIFAPGVDILSTWNNGSTNIISGTSMATPHIAGLAAYLTAWEGPADGPIAMCERIQQLSLKGAARWALSNNNDIAYNGGPEAIDA